MLQAIANTLKKMASLKIIGVWLFLFIVSNILINGKPFGLAQLQVITNGVSIPDMEMFGYAPQRVYDILTAQGEAGRAFYLHYIVPQDFPFPFFYALFYATLLTYLAQRLFPNNSRIQQIGVIGLFAGLADWMENLCLLPLLLQYPQRMDAVARLASGFTVTKAILIVLNMGIILIGLGWMLVNFVKTKVLSHVEHGTEK